jgi:uncharacterized protein (TIGR03089 family)
VPRTPTPGDHLDHWLRARSAAPAITYYGTDGGRVELSGVTAANAVAKAANVFTGELLLDPGEVVWIDLPCHWQSPILTIAAWAAGLTVAVGPEAHGAAATVSSRAEPHRATGTGLAVSLHPFGQPLGADTPAGWEDLAALARIQPDSATPVWPEQDQPWVACPDPVTGIELLQRSEESAARWDLPEGGRLLSRLAPQSLLPLLACTLVPAIRGGSLILTDMADVTAIVRQEGNLVVADSV